MSICAQTAVYSPGHVDISQFLFLFYFNFDSSADEWKRKKGSPPRYNDVHSSCRIARSLRHLHFRSSFLLFLHNSGPTQQKKRVRLPSSHLLTTTLTSITRTDLYPFRLIISFSSYSFYVSNRSCSYSRSCSSISSNGTSSACILACIAPPPTFVVVVVIPIRDLSDFKTCAPFAPHPFVIQTSNSILPLLLLLLLLLYKHAHGYTMNTCTVQGSSVFTFIQNY